MCRTAMGVPVDVDKLARADGKKDQRKDWGNNRNENTKYNIYNLGTRC
jgi:hypothetical protein